MGCAQSRVIDHAMACRPQQRLRVVRPDVPRFRCPRTAWSCSVTTSRPAGPDQSHFRGADRLRLPRAGGRSAGGPVRRTASGAPRLPGVNGERPRVVGSGGETAPTLSRTRRTAWPLWPGCANGQPWCDGQVSMTGGGLCGSHAVGGGALCPSAAAVGASLNTTAAKMTAAFYDHGMPGIRNALNWTALIGQQERGSLPSHRRPAPDGAGEKGLAEGCRCRPPRHGGDGGTGASWRDWLGHAARATGSGLARIIRPGRPDQAAGVGVVTGWWDLFVPLPAPQLRAIAAGRRLRRRSPPWHGCTAIPGELDGDPPPRASPGWARPSWPVSRRHRGTR